MVLLQRSFEPASLGCDVVALGLPALWSDAGEEDAGPALKDSWEAQEGA